MTCKRQIGSRIPSRETLRVWLLALICVGTAPRLSIADGSLDELLEAWNRREEFIRSARFEWSVEHTIYPGSLEIPGKGPLPKETVVQSGRGPSFAFDDNRFAYRYFLQDYLGRDGPLALSAVAFDGETAASYHPPDGLEYGQGAIHSTPEFREFNNFNIWPFLLHCRPLSEHGVGLRAADLTLDAESPLVGGVPTMLATWSVPGSRREFYVETERPYNVRRFAQWDEDEASRLGELVLRAELEILELRRHSDEIDVPSRWRLVFYHPDGRMRSETIGVLERYVINQEVPDGEFSLLPFPEGTLVVDERDGQKWWQGAGGSRELVSARERLPAPRDESYWSLVVFNVLAIALLFAVYAGHRIVARIRKK